MHMTLTAIDPPGSADRRWRCMDCGLSGILQPRPRVWRTSTQRGWSRIIQWERIFVADFSRLWGLDK